MRDLIRRHPLVSYFALAYALSWSYWVPLLVLGLHVAPGSTTTHFPGLLGPAVAACIVEAAVNGRRGLLALMRPMVLVTSPQARFWAYSLSPLGFLAVALLLMRARGSAMPGIGEFARFSGLPELGLPVVLLLVFLIGGYGEELGWRGFALSRLQERFGALGGALVLGLLWAGWHLPTFGVIETYREMSVPMIVGGFLFGILCGSVVLAHVWTRTGGSVLAVTLWHTTYNFTTASSAGRGFVGAVTSACVMAWALLLVGHAWRTRKLQR